MINIIWVFGLIKVSLTIFSIPLKHVTKGMLAGKTISSDVVSINLETGVDWISFVLNLPGDAMVSSPKPGIIDNYITAIDLDHVRCFDFILVWSTNTSKDIMHRSWVSITSLISFIAPLEEGIALVFTSLKEEAGNSNSVNVSNFDARETSSGDKGSQTHTEDDCVRILDLD